MTVIMLINHPAGRLTDIIYRFKCELKLLKIVVKNYALKTKQAQ